MGEASPKADTERSCTVVREGSCFAQQPAPLINVGLSCYVNAALTAMVAVTCIRKRCDDVMGSLTEETRRELLGHQWGVEKELSGDLRIAGTATKM